MEQFLEVRPNESICFERIGNPDGALIINLEGHSAQRIAVPTGYLTGLTEAGYDVVSFDNRDVGRSLRATSRYTLFDMVEDTHALIKHFGKPAVLTGRSMGGMISQLLAIKYPEEVLGLGLFYTRAKHTPATEMSINPQAPFENEESYVQYREKSMPRLAGSKYPYPEGHIEKLARQMWERGVSFVGNERQSAAMAATEPWAEETKGIKVPTIIVHGDEDGVIDVEEAHLLHELIPDSKLEIVQGMGHQQPAQLNDFFIEATASVAPKVR
ncbi:alpha/beta fold hydrolase [Gleimia hominis]|uniref:alpha/beta fold hydrolase n=1 Tax=Gleimia hominis TaxID=595468 RepID=UPI0013046C1E|nr:alpha/beta hydrolase [Gleimia hominis]WIK63759.1 alpha/beta hydrolase [Gleimia hominis]